MRRHYSTKKVTDEMWSKEGRTHCRVTAEDSYLGRNSPWVVIKPFLFGEEGLRENCLP